MNVYTVNHDGVYIEGVSLVIAESVDMALILINKKLESMSLPKVEKKDIKQQDTSTRRVDVLFNGDY